MPYYPATTLIVPAVTVRRERRLPSNTISSWAIREGSTVSADEVIIRGLLPADFMVIDALRPLGLKRAEQINEDMLQVSKGGPVFEGDAILTIGKGRRAKSLKAPTNAVFARIEGSDVILQTNPDPVDVVAMYPGKVTSLRHQNTTALIETAGALIQGVWGNDKIAYSQLRLEPRDGIESLLGDTLVPEYRGLAVVMTKPIRSDVPFKVAHQQSMTAIIAPSMHSNLRQLALEQSIPVLLLEGFGELDLSEIVYNLMRDNDGRPATINAVEPTRWSADRPEVMITLSTNIPAPLPITDQPLGVGSLVRIIRAPLRGKSGRVKRLIDTPRQVENGLRLLGAEVELTNGQVHFVPLANLEMLGRAVEG